MLTTGIGSYLPGCRFRNSTAPPRSGLPQTLHYGFRGFEFAGVVCFFPQALFSCVLSANILTFAGLQFRETLMDGVRVKRTRQASFAG